MKTIITYMYKAFLQELTCSKNSLNIFFYIHRTHQRYDWQLQHFVLRRWNLVSLWSSAIRNPSQNCATQKKVEIISIKS